MKSDDLNALEFAECHACSTQPGAPQLCSTCLHNRRVIGTLRRRVKQAETIAEAYEEFVPHLTTVISKVVAAKLNLEPGVNSDA